MRPNRVPVSVLAAALSACVVEPELLNSERIKSRFGSYGIDVLTDSESLRRSNLYSVHGEKRICRTYAVVSFRDVPRREIRDEHAQIVAGESIGKTFRAQGWQIFKETRYIGETDLPADGDRIRMLMNIDGSRPVAMHVYRLLLRKNGSVIDYATIVELHHPDYLDADELTRLFDVDESGTATRDDIARWGSALFAE